MDSDSRNSEAKISYDKRLYQVLILSSVAVFTLLYLFTFQWCPYLWRRFLLYREKRQALREVLNRKYKETPNNNETTESKDPSDNNNHIKKDKEIYVPPKFAFKKKEVVENIDSREKVDLVKKNNNSNNNTETKDSSNNNDIKKDKEIYVPPKFALKKRSTSSTGSGNSNNLQNDEQIHSSYDSFNVRNNMDYNSQSNINNIRNLRSIQDEEYLESLRQEEEQKEQLIFEEQLKEAERLSLLLEAKRVDDLREKVALSIENSENNNSESITLLFKTPNIDNKKLNLKRKFTKKSTILDVIEYLDVYFLIDNNINDINNNNKIEVMEGAPPRRLLTSFPYETTLEDLSLISNSVLWVTLK